MYNILGLPEQAIKHFTEAVTLASSIYPDTKKNVKLAQANENLAKCYITTANIEKANFHIKIALEIKTNVYGENHPETASAIHYMGNMALA